MLLSYSNFRALIVPVMGIILPLSYLSDSYANTPLNHVNRAVEVARALLDSDNPYDQILGAGTLSDIGDRNALAFLADYAMSADIVFQRAAIDALIAVQHPNGADLLHRLASENANFRQFLAQSLATNPREDMGQFLIGILPGSKPLVQQYAMQALVHVKESDSAIDAVNDVLNEPKVLDTTRAYAYYYLAERGLGNGIEADLLELVASGDLNQREVAAVALKHIDTKSAKEALVELQGSQDARVSLAALASNAALGDEASIAELLNVISRGKSLNAEVGASAVRRLPPKLAYRLSKELFAQNLRPDPGTRLIESWRAIDWDASDIYQWGLAHENVDVRMQTLWLIGQRQERSMLSKLAGFLTDKHARLRGMAAWAIVHISPEDYVPGTKV